MALLFAPGAGQPGPNEFIVDQATGKPVRGAIREIAENHAVTFEGALPVHIDGDEFVGLYRADLALPSRPVGPRLELVGGDVLPGEVIDVGRDRLTFRAQTGTTTRSSRLSLPLSAVSVIRLTPSEDRAEVRRQARSLANEQRGQDVVWLSNGEHLLGTFTGLTDKSLSIEVGEKAMQVERNKVVLIGFNSELTQAPTAKGPFGHVVLASGGRIGLGTFQVRGGTLSGKVLTGDEFSAPWDDVVAIDLRQGRTAYLSDLKPKAYKYTPFLPGLQYSWEADRTVDGEDLTLRGNTFDKGIGMHDQSQLTYSLAGQRRFEAVVGLEEKVPPGACVRVKVLLDGKADGGWEKELRAGDGPQVVRVNVAEAKELTLIVEFAAGTGRPFVGGRVNWGNARLVK
jgi:hypothetical protein